MNRAWLRGAAALSVSAALAAGPGAGRDQPLDAALASSDGEVVRLRDQRGLPTVLFYEGRNSTSVNQQTKDELFARGKRDGLLRAAKVLAVANLKGYDWFPAREFALAGVREAQAKAGVPILVDWRGVLCDPPWSLPPHTSSVLLLDSGGRVVFERSGRLSNADRAELFGALHQLISSAPKPGVVAVPVAPPGGVTAPGAAPTPPAAAR